MALSGAVTAAEVIRGAWPSVRGCESAALPPSRLPAASSIRGSLTATVPVAPAAAAAPSNASTCAAVPLPDSDVTVRRTPSPRVTVGYAEGHEALTGSLYRTVASLGPETVADVM